MKKVKQVLKGITKLFIRLLESEKRKPKADNGSFRIKYAKEKETI